MKNSFYLLLVCCCLNFISCNTESFEDEVLQEETDPNIPEEESEITSTTPCDFDLSEITSNSTITIDCILDLGGAEISLPDNVNFDFNGGDITNGTINFNGGYIDGRLLSSKLTVNGDVKLKEPTLKYVPSRWTIVQGETTSAVALENRDHLENIFAMVQKLEGNTLEIDKLDAYFEVSLVTHPSDPNFRASLEAINVPSNFNLKMTNNTKLRVFPNNRQTYALLSVREASDVTISGGILLGDRDEHDYSAGDQEWGYLVFLKAAVNTTISGMTLKNAMGDGMKIQSLKFFYEPDHIPTHDIVITKCIFDSNRRNNMSITGGYDIYVDDNQFLNASVDTDSSEGVAPGFAIDIEATRKRDEATGEMFYYERAEDIYITNNTETGSRIGGFTVAIGYDVTIENNTVETGISYSFANGTKIIGNTVVAPESGRSGAGIKAGRENGDDATIYDNLVSKNTVRGFGTSIFVSNRDVVIEGNNLEDFGAGINMSKLTNAEIKNNILNSERDGSIGIVSSTTGLDNVSIFGNNVTVARNPIKMSNLNLEPEASDYVTSIYNNVLNTPNDSSTLFIKSTGIEFTDNELNHQIEVFNCDGIAFMKNSVTDSDDHGFHLREVNNNINIANNTINVSDNRECIQIEDSTSTSEVTITNNTCQ
ncbi:hypothetical protein GCM10022393_13710 [Aquimarina addita]|uniref:Right handed beta helix domain-containing protein n=1 Tax=Aquimarina addita TaxID=870485 RepID=A0ABP7XF22_9FLAO